MRNHSFRIALSAVACALAVVFLTLGMYVSVLTLTAYVFACLAIMLPLAKQFRLSAFLCYIATCLLALLFGGVGNFWRLFAFVIFFGLHPIVNSLQLRFNINKWIALIVKIVWFDVSVWFVWEFAGLFVVQYEWINRYILLIIATLGSAFFVFYDFVMFRCQRLVTFYVNKISRQ